jgi:hypothetical protein
VPIDDEYADAQRRLAFSIALAVFYLKLSRAFSLRWIE